MIARQTVYAALARRYAEPARHYHMLQHVRRCLRDLDWARGAIADADAVELALWFHDVIYAPGASDNERRSAEWFRQRADGNIVAVEHITRLILDTSNTSPPSDAAGCLLSTLMHPCTGVVRRST